MKVLSPRRRAPFLGRLIDWLPHRTSEPNLPSPLEAIIAALGRPLTLQTGSSYVEGSFAAITQPSPEACAMKLVNEHGRAVTRSTILVMSGDSGIQIVIDPRVGDACALLTLGFVLRAMSRAPSNAPGYEVAFANYSAASPSEQESLAGPATAATSPN